ncbi:MAG: DNA-binding response regulator, partial [Actinobacteria bacterium]|nr:DNA-binding response regulator [Actinomycetota bacterium]NIS34993.1 DNA-binding response regulator [Actinomycetota bacterium]NIU66675.1 DNA-binding response regulator [Actinomycetota bacterium]NIW28480.1 DNA-binding response regulator [Actinomycetota bacterium]NIX20963.1 DNA-binding response regulator [Actinomycetota bacterium]
YALDAFDAHAVDYLLKPVEPERFRSAMRKVRRQLDYEAGRGMTERVAAMLRDLERRERDLDRFLVKGRGRSYFIDVAEIDWIEAAGNY